MSSRKFIEFFSSSIKRTRREREREAIKNSRKNSHFLKWGNILVSMEVIGDVDEHIIGGLIRAKT